LTDSASKDYLVRALQICASSSSSSSLVSCRSIAGQGKFTDVLPLCYANNHIGAVVVI